MSRKYKLYTPYKIERMTEKEIRAEYSKLRSVANKRLERMREQNIGMLARTGYSFPTIQQVYESSKDTIESALADVSNWLRSDRTTIKGERQAVQEFQNTIGEKYPELVKDLDTTYFTMEMLNDARDEYTNNLYESGDVLDVLQKAEYLNISRETLQANFNIFYNHRMEFEKIKNPKRKGYTPKAVERMISKYYDELTEYL